MKSKFTWILTLCLAFFIQFSFAQEKTVTGTVVSKTDKMTMPGVNVLVQGTTRGVQTDFNGNYSIKVAVGQKLQFSFLGSKNLTITVGASNTINVQLEEDDATELKSVVVEGYGMTRTKKTSNVASVTVSSKTLEGRPNANFLQSLQSQVAGLSIASGSGQPGANAQVILRGVGSLTGKIEPLYVIDGVPMNSDNFRSLNPDDIESVSVLKDAGATSLYGSRGASGVIVVKTKKGGFESALKVRYVASTGFSTMQQNKYNLMNTTQLLALEKAKGVGAGAGDGLDGAKWTPEEIQENVGGINTDWRKVFFRTGVTQNHVVSFSQGSKSLSSFTSIGYFNQEGILKGTDLKRFTLRSNLDGRSKNEKFQYNTNLSINFSRNNSATSLGTGGVNQNYVLGAFHAVPYISPDAYTDAEGVYDLYGQSGTLIYTPLMLMDKLKTFRNSSDELKAIASMGASYKVAKNWTLGTNLGIDYTQINSFVYESPESFNALVFEAQNLYTGSEDQSFSRDASFNWNNRLSYNKVFADKHTIDVSLFTEYYKAHFKSMSFSQNGLDPKADSPGNGTGYYFTQPQDGPDLYVPQVGASAAEAGMFSYFAVADYDYEGKFGLGGTVRRDASSRFAESNRWGTFYSVSGRWNIDREKFMEGSIFDLLKLRGSYGTTGNQDIANGVYSALNSSRELYDISRGYQGKPSYVLSQLPNPNLKWETSVQGNIGLDFDMINSKLRVNLDVYNKDTNDLYQALPVSLVNGTANILTNFGSMNNKGVEANVVYDIVKNNNGLNFTLKANGAYNKNSITSLPSVNTVTVDGQQVNYVDNGAVVNAEGRRLNEFYLTRYIGVNPANGNLLFLDKNGNATENPDQSNDRVFTGKSSIPVYQGGFGFDADYKGFFLNTQFSWAADVWRFDYDLASYQKVTDIGVFNKSTDLQRAWANPGDHTDIPSLNYTNTSADTQSDRYLKDASYLRLKFMSLGYSFPKTMLSKSPFSMAKVFVNTENIVTWSKWRGFDAESTRGADQNQYPTPKIVSFGLNLEF